MGIKLRPLTTTKSLTPEELEVVNANYFMIEAALNSVGAGTPLVPGSTTPPLPGISDHHLLLNLGTFDDHPQYLYLAGRSGATWALQKQQVVGPVYFSGHALAGDSTGTMVIKPSGSLNAWLHLGSYPTLITQAELLFYDGGGGLSVISSRYGDLTIQAGGGANITEQGYTLFKFQDVAGNTAKQLVTIRQPVNTLGTNTQDLLDFQNSSTTKIAWIDYLGGAHFPTANIVPTSTSTIPFTITKKTAATVDLTCWYDTDGTTRLSYIDQYGNFNAPAGQVTTKYLSVTNVADRAVLINRGTSPVEGAVGSTNTVLRGQGSSTNPDFGTINKDYIDNRTRRVAIPLGCFETNAKSLRGSTVNSIPVITMNTGALTRTFFTFKVPVDFVSGGKINIYLANQSTDITDVVYNLYTKKLTAAASVVAAYDNLDTFTNVTPGLTDILFLPTVNISTSIAAGDILRFCIERDGVTDGNLGHISLLGADFEYTADM